MTVLEGDELHDSFAGIIDSHRKLRVAGFGSLLSEKSARFTFPDLEDFQIAKIRGYRRVFAHCAPIFFKRGIANLETKEISSVAVEPDPNTDLIISCFSITPTSEAIEAFIEREHEFKFVAVQCYSLSGEALESLAVICCRWNDQDYRASRCPDKMFHERYGQYGIEQIYRDDILPCRVYLRHCVLAAKHLDAIAYENFLDTTFLGDRTTTIRRYLEHNLQIMETLPPKDLEDRYSG